MTHGRRIFRMPHYHHHFELKGWPEPKVIVRFWIIAIFSRWFPSVTLKIRLAVPAVGNRPTGIRIKNRLKAILNVRPRLQALTEEDET